MHHSLENEKYLIQTLSRLYSSWPYALSQFRDETNPTHCSIPQIVNSQAHWHILTPLEDLGPTHLRCQQSMLSKNGWVRRLKHGFREEIFMLNRDILESEPLANKLNIQLYDDGHIHYISW